ncbi:coiled-coil domain-containing protein [Haloferax sp. YSSS75]|uniref:coiled-coil domain-containing protein n=1 Tax=Haloferax sp. YSSS75 TaxID=3388564 RepID=UPI00398C9DCC
MSDDDPVSELRTAATKLDAYREDVETVGRDELRRLATTYRDVERILDRFEERATDPDDFQGYIEFRETLTDRLESAPADIRHGEAFIQANDALTTAVTSSLSSSDFERARTLLADVRADVELLESLQDAEDAYRSKRRAVQSAKAELESRIDRLERIEELGRADIDAPISELRTPIERYNEAVTEAFERFRRESSARDVVDWLSTAELFPLVGMPSPPPRLESYLHTADVGDEPLSKLVEYTEYSRSKLDHYVDSPQEFDAAVKTNSQFLHRVDGEPLTVSWPPAPASTVRWRARELVSVVGRFASESVVSEARSVRRLVDRTDYERLREAAIAREELTDDQREKLRRGVISDELSSVRDEYEHVVSCLDAHPPLGD